MEPKKLETKNDLIKIFSRKKEGNETKSFFFKKEYLEEFSIGFIGHEFAATLVLQIWNSRALVVYNVHLYRLSLSKVTKQ